MLGSLPCDGILSMLHTTASGLWPMFGRVVAITYFMLKKFRQQLAPKAQHWDNKVAGMYSPQSAGPFSSLYLWQSGANHWWGIRCTALMLQASELRQQLEQLVPAHQQFECW